VAQRRADLSAPSDGSPEHASPQSATPPLSKSRISKVKSVKHREDTETNHPTKPRRSDRRSRLESGNGNQNPEAYIASDWKSHENRRKILEAAAAQLGLTDLSGWYKVKISDIKGTEAHRMIRQEFDGSLWNALVECFSEHNWQAWMLGRIPANWWMERKNQRQYVDEYLSPALGITSLSGWYSVTEDQMIAAGAGRLLSIYDSSTSNILTTLYQEHTWELWRFPKIPRGFWIDPENCCQFLESMSSVLGIQKKEDWNHVTLSQLSKAAGRKTSLRIPSPKGDRNLSLFELLKSAYPEDWKAWQRSKVPKGFWASLDQQRIFVEEIAKSTLFHLIAAFPFCSSFKSSSLSLQASTPLNPKTLGFTSGTLSRLRRSFGMVDVSLFDDMITL
jgi:hypothetical protein